MNVPTSRGYFVRLDLDSLSLDRKELRFARQVDVFNFGSAELALPQTCFELMATGTGKTYTAFQIIYRLWKAKAKRRTLFLADRTALIDQTRRGDFKDFKQSMTVVQKRQVNKAYEVYLALYQGLTGSEDVRSLLLLNIR